MIRSWTRPGRQNQLSFAPATSLHASQVIQSAARHEHGPRMSAGHGPQLTPRFCVCVDGSVDKRAQWAASHLSCQGAGLHIISISCPCSRCLCGREMVPAAATVQAHGGLRESKAALQIAERACAEGLKIAPGGGCGTCKAAWLCRTIVVPHNLFTYAVTNRLWNCCCRS
jgi:hypothetical protein